MFFAVCVSTTSLVMELICVTIILVILFSAEDCHACFHRNNYVDLGPRISNTPFYQECICYNSTTPEHTAKHLKWLDINDQEIGPMGSAYAYTERIKYGVNLIIPSLSTTMSGKYKCVMDHDDGTRYAQIYKVDVYDKLYIHNTETVQYLVKGRNSRINCEAKGKTPPVITWIKMNDMDNNKMDMNEISSSEQILSLDDKYNITKEGVIVKNVTDDDGGTYKCAASVMETGEDVETYIKVEVMTEPEMQEIVAIPDNRVIVGSSLSLECKAIGFPLPTYSWYKVNQTANVTDQIITWRQEYDNSTIIFESIKPEDRGSYECKAENKVGSVKRKYYIDVLTPPIITHFENVTAAEGSTEQIICRVSGWPTPIVNIFFTSESIEDDPSVTWSLRNISDSEVELNLTFNKVNRSHAGSYNCTALNEVGETGDNVYLSVLYKPYFDQPQETVWAWIENPINLTCDYHSEPLADVDWRYEGSPNHILAYGNDTNKIIMMLPNSHRNRYLNLKHRPIEFGRYVCTAKNHLGESKKVFDVREGVVPMTVKNLTIIDVKTASATFFVEPPEHAGPPIIGFLAEYDELENYKVTDIHLNRTWALSKEYKLDKLKPGTNYLIKFAAINKVGTGRFGEMIEFDTPEKSAPEPPTTLHNGSITNRIILLKAPEDNGGNPIDYYVVKYCPVQSIGDEPEEDTSCEEFQVEPTTELQLKDLAYNTTYYLMLVAHNSEGNSTPTESWFELLMTETPPSDEPVLSGGAIIAIAVVMVILGILLLDVLLFLTKRQGMIANCCCKKTKKKKDTSVLARDKKGLLKDNGESVASDTLKRPDNGHKEFEYNKTTGIITGKHSAV